MSRRRSGITLPELAAVVAALVVLVALLSPALAGVRRHSKGTLCLQNLATIAQASIVYASQDPDEQVIPVHPVFNSPTAGSSRMSIPTMAYGGKSGRGRWSGNKYYWGTLLGRGPASRPMNPILYKRDFPNFAPPPFGDYEGSDMIDKGDADAQLDLEVFRCPADDGPPSNGLAWTSWKVSGLPSYDCFGTSYYANACWVTNGSYFGANAAFLRPLSAVPNPANTVYYQEHTARFAWMCAARSEWDPCIDPDPRTLWGWHGEAFRFTTAFVDGHAQATLMRSYEAPHLGHYPDYADPVQGHGYYKCVIMRGPDWQLDTLPAPVMWTSIPVDCGATACESREPRAKSDAPRQDAGDTQDAAGGESDEPGALRPVIPAEGDFAL